MPPIIRINLADGQTLSFDLEIPEDAVRWDTFRRDLRSDVRGAILQTASGQTSVPIPRGFRTVYLSADEVPGRDGEIVGDRIEVQADEIRLSVVVYRRSPMTRIDLSRIGRPRMLT